MPHYIHSEEHKQNIVYKNNLASIEKYLQEIKIENHDYKHHISSLQPISRNQIVNTKYIGKVYLEDNSRVSLRLVGSDTYLHVGKNYTDTFREWYIE
ncbi:MAG: LytTR family transcriptional regulator DNA-binding domain-containing protein [Firmicutes bacterium]|nr:LytTR family transcriptional regulator DNA-binding domain-containing protein [Bacillota bacterium]